MWESQEVYRLIKSRRLSYKSLCLHLHIFTLVKFRSKDEWKLAKFKVNRCCLRLYLRFFARLIYNIRSSYKVDCKLAITVNGSCAINHSCCPNQQLHGFYMSWIWSSLLFESSCTHIRPHSYNTSKTNLYQS